VGDSSLPEAGMDLIDMASVPDGFDQETDFNLGIAVLALGFGMDARELAPALVSGATRADALLQHLKQRGKGPGQIIQTTEQLFDFRVLPPYLQMLFDYQDDEQDRQAAETKEVRSRRWRTAVDSNVLDTRTSRQQMVEVGDLDRAQYERLEMEDGRLPDGTSVLGLFASKDPEIRGYLRLGLPDFNPFDVDPETVQDDVLPAVRKKMLACQDAIVNGENQNVRWKAVQAFYALKELEKKALVPDMPPQLLAGQAAPGTPKSQLNLPQKDERLRKISPITPNRTAVDARQKLEPDSDDDVKEQEGGGAETEWPFRW
jgi:hypothetical protein